MEKALRIDIVSDTVCPWCYVGKRNLEAALAQRPDVQFDCHWQPFQLNPDMPMGGVDRKTHWQQKFGDESRIKEMSQRLVEVGQTMGLEFHFDAIAIQPNTLKSHALLHHFQTNWSVQNALKEKILAAFFVEGLDIGNDAVLTELAEQCDVDPDVSATILQDGALLDEVRQLDQEARRLGISGVPTFIFNRQSALVGAQPTAQLLHAIDQATAA